MLLHLLVFVNLGRSRVLGESFWVGDGIRAGVLEVSPSTVGEGGGRGLPLVLVGGGDQVATEDAQGILGAVARVFMLALCRTKRRPMDDAVEDQRSYSPAASNDLQARDEVGRQARVDVGADGVAVVADTGEVLRPGGSG